MTEASLSKTAQKPALLPRFEYGSFKDGKGSDIYRRVADISIKQLGFSGQFEDLLPDQKNQVMIKMNDLLDPYSWPIES